MDAKLQCIDQGFSYKGAIRVHTKYSTYGDITTIENVAGTDPQQFELFDQLVGDFVANLRRSLFREAELSFMTKVTCNTFLLRNAEIEAIKDKLQAYAAQEEPSFFVSNAPDTLVRCNDSGKQLWPKG